MVANKFIKELSLIKHSEFLKQLNIVDIEYMLKGVVLIAL
jgi:hypothetical protein